MTIVQMDLFGNKVPWYNIRRIIEDPEKIKVPYFPDGHNERMKKIKKQDK